MKILLDRDRCEGHGLCIAHAPAAFDFDDEDVVTFLLDAEDIPESEMASVREAAAACPVAALRTSP